MLSRLTILFIVIIIKKMKHRIIFLGAIMPTTTLSHAESNVLKEGTDQVDADAVDSLTSRELKALFQEALICLQKDQKSLINLENVVKQMNRDDVTIDVINNNKCLLSVNLGVIRIYEALERFKNQTTINVAKWTRLSYRTLLMESELPLSFINIHKKDGTVTIPKLLKDVDNLMNSGYAVALYPTHNEDFYADAINRILNQQSEHLDNSEPIELTFENLATELGLSERYVRVLFSKKPNLINLYDQACLKQAKIFPSNLTELENALDRLIANNPIRVPKNRRITKSLIAEEAGMDRTTIRSTRKRFHLLIERMENFNKNNADIIEKRLEEAKKRVKATKKKSPKKASSTD
jgi:hypothetical protein